jgi:hypothetical protein
VLNPYSSNGRTPVFGTGNPSSSLGWGTTDALIAKE